ncbi:MAG: MarR family winged helix-turn-helix transcriptional regulator [Thermocrispum sp.]
MSGTATRHDPAPPASAEPPASPDEASGSCRKPSTAELATADELGNQFGRFMRVMTKAKSRLSGLAHGSLEHSAFPIIAGLVREGPSRTSAIAERLHTDISTISRQTSALVQAGLIERQADPDDGRACLLAPTDAGRALYERGRTARNHWLAMTLQHWPDGDADRLIALLDRLNDDLSDHLSAPNEPEGDSA